MNQAFLLATIFRRSNSVTFLREVLQRRRIALLCRAGRVFFLASRPAPGRIFVFLHSSRGKVAFRVYFVGLGVSSMLAALKLKRRSGLSCLRKDMRAELSIIMSHRLGDVHQALICTRV